MKYLCEILKHQRGINLPRVVEAHGESRTAAQAAAYELLSAEDKAMFLPPAPGEPLEYAPNDERGEVRVYGPF